MYTLDTNIIIALLQGDKKIEEAIAAWQESDTPVITSTITLIELLAFPKITSAEEFSIKQFIMNTRLVAVDWNVAEVAAYIRRKYGLKIPDSIIAATAWLEGPTLVTRNVRDFKRITEIQIESI